VSGAAFRDATTSFVYAVWTDLSGAAGCTSGASEPDTDATSTCKSRIWFARSATGGTRWDALIMLNNPASRNDQFNPRVAVDDNDGTFGDASRLKTNIWYQSSSDNGSTWTSAVMVSSGQTDETSAGADSGNQYGDYNGLSGRRGIFPLSWTDRRGGGFEEIWTSPLNPDSVTDLVLATFISQL